jgi:opacity protein-like surface antigen
MRRWTGTALLLLAGLLAAPAAARAQGALVHASVGAAASDGQTSPAFGGGVTWRVNKALGFGVELSHLRSLASDYSYYCCDDEADARATVFTTNVRLEIPTTSARVIPYVVGGGGVASLTQSYSVIYLAQEFGLGLDLAALGLNTIPAIWPGPSEMTTTTTSMALTLGGGASLLVTDHVAVDADARVLHIAADRSRNIGRFSLGVSYRF